MKSRPNLNEEATACLGSQLPIHCHSNRLSIHYCCHQWPVAPELIWKWGVPDWVAVYFMPLSWTREIIICKSVWQSIQHYLHHKQTILISQMLIKLKRQLSTWCAHHSVHFTPCRCPCSDSSHVTAPCVLLFIIIMSCGFHSIYARIETRSYYAGFCGRRWYFNTMTKV